MINLERILHSDPEELANMICYLCHDCVNCPVCGPEGPDTSMDTCRRNLYYWIMSQEDEPFWEYLKKGDKE